MSLLLASGKRQRPSLFNRFLAAPYSGDTACYSQRMCNAQRRRVFCSDPIAVPPFQTHAEKVRHSERQAQKKQLAKQANNASMANVGKPTCAWRVGTLKHANGKASIARQTYKQQETNGLKMANSSHLDQTLGPPSMNKHASESTPSGFSLALARGPGNLSM